jgi:molecular chaperone DnaJ
MRARYDQFGEAGLGNGMGGGGGYGGEGFEVDLSDIFDSVSPYRLHAQQRLPALSSQSCLWCPFFSRQFFGGGGRRSQRQQGPMRGEDLRVDTTIQFEEAVFGTEKKIRIRHLENCNTCTGSGVKPGSAVKTCSQCGGSGMVTQIQRTPLGTFQTQTMCPGCRGAGKQVEEYCGVCSGQGVVEEPKNVKVKVPPGIEDGTKLRLRGEGDAGPKGGPPGDLYVFLRVQPHPTFNRKGSDIFSDMTVDYTDAILGNDAVTVPVVDGEVQLKVPQGTQPGTVLRVRGKGAPQMGNPDQRGDHYVTVKVNIPKDLDKEEKELLTKLRDKNSRQGSKKGKGFNIFN